jgi:hypothetical protein
VQHVTHRRVARVRGMVRECIVGYNSHPSSS